MGVHDTLTDLDDTAPAALRPTTEGWADSYRQPYPGHEHPRSSFDMWKSATTG